MFESCDTFSIDSQVSEDSMVDQHIFCQTVAFLDFVSKISAGSGIDSGRMFVNFVEKF